MPQRAVGISCGGLYASQDSGISWFGPKSTFLSPIFLTLAYIHRYKDCSFRQIAASPSVVMRGLKSQIVPDAILRTESHFVWWSVHMLQNDKLCLFSHCQTVLFSCVGTIGIKFPLRDSLVFIHLVFLTSVSHQFSLINIVINQGLMVSPLTITACL